MTELKHCHTCGQDKPRDQFGRNRSAANGLESYCKPCHNRRNQEYRATIAVRNPELAAKQAAEKAARNRKWRLANPDKDREHGRRWRAANGEQDRERRRQASARIKAEVFDHYGWACACCGATARPTIDHIDGNGKTHRYELFGGRINPSSREFYRWLIKNGFPEGFQTLCHRCNTSKGTGPACGLDHTKAARATRVARTTQVAELQKRVRELECQLAAALEALELSTNISPGQTT